jgi:hypothetical protein
MVLSSASPFAEHGTTTVLLVEGVGTMPGVASQLALQQDVGMES